MYVCAYNNNIIIFYGCVCARVCVYMHKCLCEYAGVCMCMYVICIIA